MADLLRLDFAGFEPSETNKVERLLGILAGFDADEYLGKRLALHGGTALNVFLFSLPRLSVDIDVVYVANTDPQVMEAERDGVEARLTQITEALGYRVALKKWTYAGRPVVLRYTDPHHGRDRVKVDVNYLSRSPLLPLERRTVRTPSGMEVTFRTKSAVELIAGKMQALIERQAVRDLYDVGNIAGVYARMRADGDEVLIRRVVLYHLSLTERFPRAFAVSGRFAGHELDVATQLAPMLRAGAAPDFDEMVHTAQAFLTDVATPRDDAEAQYLASLANGQFNSDLLFDEYPDVCAAAKADPVAERKTHNLARAPAALFADAAVFAPGISLVQEPGAGRERP